MKSYFAYHMHTDFSNCGGFMDSVSKPIHYVDLVKESGMKSLCFTEHGNMYSWLSKKELAESNGLKYVHGVEAYVTVDKSKSIRDNYHVVMLARNYDGFKELNKLISKSFDRENGSFYYNNRISIDELISTSDNIIITTACVGGILSTHNSIIMKKFMKFAKENKDRVFVEVQPHNNFIQKQFNIKIKNIAKENGLRLVAGTDTHNATDEHRRGRMVLQMSKNPDMRHNKEWNLQFRTREELEQEFKSQGALTKDEYITAIDNTLVIEDMIEPFEVDNSFKYPKLYEDSEKEFQRRIVQAMKNRGIELTQERRERINMEFKIYRETGTIDYMLLESDIKNFCRENDISVSYGRGSVTGSYIAYVLGIHQMDSIKHNLIFERFINPERVSLADIDTDYTDEGREKVKEFLYNIKGLHCSSIITFNTIADRGSIKDVARAFKMDLSIAEEICKSLDTDDEQKYRDAYPKLFEYVEILKGTVVSMGSHPAGTIVSPIPLDESIGLCSADGTPEPISMLYMKEVDRLNFVKLDLLGLKTLEVIEMACKFANIDFVVPDFLDEVAWNDEKVWRSIGEESLLIFQMDTNSGRPFCKDMLSEETVAKIKDIAVEFSYIELLAIANGAIRPSGESYRDSIKRGEVHEYGFKALDDFFSSTLGNCVFQEQIMEFLYKFCKMKLGEADLVRRAIAKGGNAGEFSEQIEKGFIEHLRDEYKVEEDKAKEILKDVMRVIIDASNYAFSRNHAIPYSYNGYACGWLRTYYPLEFFTAYMNAYVKKKEEMAKVTKYMTRHTNTIVALPKFRHSHWLYGFDKETNTIYEGIGKYKKMNEAIGKGMYGLKNKEYNHFYELLIDLKKIRVNKAQREILITEDFFISLSKNTRDFSREMNWIK